MLKEGRKSEMNANETAAAASGRTGFLQDMRQQQSLLSFTLYGRQAPLAPAPSLPAPLPQASHTCPLAPAPSLPAPLPQTS
jgi:hypothetical protein